MLTFYLARPGLKTCSLSMRMKGVSILLPRGPAGSEGPPLCKAAAGDLWCLPTGAGSLAFRFCGTCGRDLWLRTESPAQHNHPKLLMLEAARGACAHLLYEPFCCSVQTNGNSRNATSLQSTPGNSDGLHCICISMVLLSSF